MLGRSLGGLAGRLRRSAGPLRQVHTSLRRCQQQQVSEGKPVVLSKLKDDFMDGTSSTYLEQLEQQYRADPSTVDRSWAAFFRSMDSGISPEALSESYDAFVKTGAKSPLPIVAEGQSPQETMRLAMLVRAHQVEGHRAAQLDPLGLQQVTPPLTLDPAYYGFEERHMDREYSLATWNQSGFMAEDRPRRTLREIVRRLRETYCGSVGFEYMHIDDHEKCNWIRERIELLEAEAFSKEKKMLVLDRLTWSEMFESFLANKYTAAKRFGLEGCEALIPGMKAAIDRTADLGTETIVIGMPHRGRLNILANVMRKPMEQVFSEFAGRRPAGASADDYTGSGDVKYHLGTSYDRPTLSGRQIHLSLMANPSHLEAVNTVALGKVRAKQYYANDEARRRNLAILLHGDGAFAGQGIVYETLDMSALPDYTVGGTIHLVVNNQVAFTTDPKKSRSSPYCTDVAKALSAPIFHVNSDDPEAVVRVCELAAEWRQTWGTDVVIDLVGYRKYGHNEIDEPMFTQPLMYKKIRAMRNVQQLYVDRLLREGSVTSEEVKGVTDKVEKLLHDSFENAKAYKPKTSDWLSSYWKGFRSPHQLSRIRNTGVPANALRDVGQIITTLPPGVTPHRQIGKVYEARRAALESGEGVDWAFAEALAFGTLLREGNHVRLSGQDVERGTFSHRHAVVHDQTTGERYTPLAAVAEGGHKSQFTVSNSSLSEFGVLGFELGYSLENPNSLVLWEAQFGDFANGAQIIFDQFLSSGEAKWLRQSGLTVLLPHGYDGQGPEHSSARIERYLQMVDDHPYAFPSIDEAQWATGSHMGTRTQNTNMQVCNVSTPAQYFHVLRRQLHRDFRKPLIIFSPKNLLRHPLARSPLSEFDDVPEDSGITGARFKRLIMDERAADRSPHPTPAPGVKKLVFCSGKIYYELATERARQGKQDEVAIVRVEQIAPFPHDLALRELRRYTALRENPAASVVYCQEEPMNMGAYSYIAPRLQTCMEAAGYDVPSKIAYAGRAPSASTATGFGEVHAQEQAALIKAALDV